MVTDSATFKQMIPGSASFPLYSDHLIFDSPIYPVTLFVWWRETYPAFWFSDLLRASAPTCPWSLTFAAIVAFVA